MSNKHLDVLNRIHNVSNPYQGTFKKVLCVCSAGLLRSPTAANVLHREYGHNTRAVGVSRDYALIPLDEVHLRWADEIVCVSAEVGSDVSNIMDSLDITEPLLVILNVPDRYPYMDDELQKEILYQYKQTMQMHELKGG